MDINTFFKQENRLLGLDFNTIGRHHFDWVEEMGWHNKTPLEAIALIFSEIGESAGECLHNRPTPKFGEELCDIILRITDLAITTNVNLNAETSNLKLVWNTGTVLENMAELCIEAAAWANTARKAELGPDFARGMARVALRVHHIAIFHSIDLTDECMRKIAINEQRGNRGRLI